MRALALCSPGAESLLREELKRQGAACDPAQPGRVDFTAETDTLAHVLLASRTADRVLLEAGRFPARNFTELYDGLYALPWEDWIPKGWFPVFEKVRLGTGQVKSAASARPVAHKAVLDRLAEKWGVVRLEHMVKEAGLRLYLDHDTAVAGLDLCGEPLSRRGYRLDTGVAPLKETLAAALVLWSGWKRGKPLLDPMCGSGTIVLEALLYGINRAPNIERCFPAAEQGVLTSESLDRVRQTLREAERVDVEMELIGRDHDPKMLRLARANAGRLGLPPERLARWCRWEESDLTEAPSRLDSVLLTNPPWGSRMGGGGESEFLRVLGNYLRNGQAATLGVVTQAEDPRRVLGLPRASIRKLRAGGLDVKILVAEGQRPCYTE